MESKTGIRSGAEDGSVALLLRQLPALRGNCLLIADENWPNTSWANINNLTQCNINLVSNRFDIARQANAAGLQCQFSDWDFSGFPDHSMDTVLFRVSKERASSHHIINQAARLLTAGGTLMLTGEKNDGVKSYVKQACKLFGDRSLGEKHGNHYLAKLCLQTLDGGHLPDKDYGQLRPIKSNPEYSYSSKPGIFGWDKIDRGSAFLMEHFAEFLQGFKHQPKTLVDLGCGYGYLACEASRHGFDKIIATDNNAAALTAVAENFSSQLNIDYSVIAGDAGDMVEGRFDSLLCNPPFHQGFSIDGDLTNRFLASAKRLLNPNGRALFVVNTFIPLEQRAKQFFAKVEVVSNNGSFKLVALAH